MPQVVSTVTKTLNSLQGMSHSDAEEEGSKYIGMLNLEPKKNVNVTTLSGGMKRKVNLGIALIGNSKVGGQIPMMMLTNLSQ